MNTYQFNSLKSWHPPLKEATKLMLWWWTLIRWTASLSVIPQWGAADTEIKVPSGKNTELKRSPFKACSRSVYSRRCHAYCQGFLSLPISTLLVHSPAFFRNLSWFLLCWLWLPHSSCVGPQKKNKVTLPNAGSHAECLRNMNMLKKQNMTCGMITC